MAADYSNSNDLEVLYNGDDPAFTDKMIQQYVDELRPMAKTPFANTMFRLSVAPDASASPRQPSPAA